MASRCTLKLYFVVPLSTGSWGSRVHAKKQMVEEQVQGSRRKKIPPQASDNEASEEEVAQEEA